MIHLCVQVSTLVVVVEIMAGSILFEDNFDLCFIDTIEWSDVVTHRRSNISFLLNEAERLAPNCNCLNFVIIGCVSLAMHQK